MARPKTVADCEFIELLGDRSKVALSTGEVADALNLNRKTAYRRLSELEDNGEVTSDDLASGTAWYLEELDPFVNRRAHTKNGENNTYETPRFNLCAPPKVSELSRSELHDEPWVVVDGVVHRVIYIEQRDKFYSTATYDPNKPAIVSDAVFDIAEDIRDSEGYRQTSQAIDHIAREAGYDLEKYGYNFRVPKK